MMSTLLKITDILQIIKRVRIFIFAMRRRESVCVSKSRTICYLLYKVTSFNNTAAVYNIDVVN